MLTFFFLQQTLPILPFFKLHYEEKCLGFTDNLYQLLVPPAQK